MSAVLSPPGPHNRPWRMGSALPLPLDFPPPQAFVVPKAPSEKRVGELLFSYSLRSLSHASKSSSLKNHPKSWDQTNRSFDLEAKARTDVTDSSIGSRA